MSDFTMSNPPEHQFPNHHPIVSPNLSSNPATSSYNPRQPPRSPVENFYHSSNSSSMQYPVQEDLFGPRLSIGGIPPPPLPSGLSHYSTTNTGGYQMQSSSSTSSSNHGSFSGPSAGYMTGQMGGGNNPNLLNSAANAANNSPTQQRRRRSSLEQLQQNPNDPQGAPHHHHHHQRTSSNGTVYEFVSLPASQNNKRPRRKYEEIERIYNCNYPNCTKAYGTLNHLNAHVTMQRHGNKRTPDEFRETRRLWKLRKKERQIMTAGQSSQQQSNNIPVSTGSGSSYSTATTAALSRPPPSGQGTVLPPLSPISVHSSSPVSSYFSRPPATGASTATVLPPTPSSSISMPMYGSDLNHMKYMNNINSNNLPYTHQPPTNYESSQYYREEMS